MLDWLGIPREETPVLVRNETVLRNPSAAQVARELGLRADVDGQRFDLVVLGGGPAGLAAAVYGGSEGLSTFVTEAWAPGGQAGTSTRIENYLGFPTGISGAELTRMATLQARRFDAVLSSFHRAVELARGPEGLVRVDLDDGQHVLARTRRRRHRRALAHARGRQHRALHGRRRLPRRHADRRRELPRRGRDRRRRRQLRRPGGAAPLARGAQRAHRRPQRAACPRRCRPTSSSGSRCTRTSRSSPRPRSPRSTATSASRRPTCATAATAASSASPVYAIFVMIGAEPCTEAVQMVLGLDPPATSPAAPARRRARARTAGREHDREPAPARDGLARRVRGRRRARRRDEAGGRGGRRRRPRGALRARRARRPDPRARAGARGRGYARHEASPRGRPERSVGSWRRRARAGPGRGSRPSARAAPCSARSPPAAFAAAALSIALGGDQRPPERSGHPHPADGLGRPRLRARRRRRLVATAGEPLRPAAHRRRRRRLALEPVVVERGRPVHARDPLRPARGGRVPARLPRFPDRPRDDPQRAGRARGRLRRRASRCRSPGCCSAASGPTTSSPSPASPRRRTPCCACSSGSSARACCSGSCCSCDGDERRGRRCAGRCRCSSTPSASRS